MTSFNNFTIDSSNVVSLESGVYLKSEGIISRIEKIVGRECGAAALSTTIALHSKPSEVMAVNRRNPQNVIECDRQNGELLTRVLTVLVSVQAQDLSDREGGTIMPLAGAMVEAFKLFPDEEDRNEIIGFARSFASGIDEPQSQGERSLMRIRNIRQKSDSHARFFTERSKFHFTVRMYLSAILAFVCDAPFSDLADHLLTNAEAGIVPSRDLPENWREIDNCQLGI